MVRSAHDVGPMVLNRGIRLVGGRTFGSGGYRVSVNGKLETVYVLAQFDRWSFGKVMNPEIVKEIADNPLDTLRIPRGKAAKEKVVPIAKGAKY